MYLQVVDKYKKYDNSTSVDEETYLYVFAPVLVEFVKWVIDTALCEGRQRLYFLSRDGYQMYLVAKRIIEDMDIDIECRYINVSRYALRIPEYHLMKEKCIDRICIGGIDVTFEKVMKRAGLTEEEAIEIAKLCGYEETYKKVMSYKKVLALKQELLQKGLFFEYVYKHSIERYGQALRYLKQEGLFDEVSCAIVDSGWVGTLQQTVNNLLVSGGREQLISGYYFGLYETPRNCEKLYKSFYFGPKGRILRKARFSNCLFEAVFTSTEGMTLYYQKKEDNIIPVFDNKENPNKVFVQKHIDMLNKYMDIYCEEFIKYDKEQKCDCYKLLKAMMGYPSKEEVEAYGNSLFSDDVLEGSMQKVAAELTDEDIRNQRFISKILIMLGIKNVTIHESAWIEGSIVRNDGKVKTNLRHARWYKYFVYIRKWLREILGR